MSRDALAGLVLLVAPGRGSGAGDLPPPDHDPGRARDAADEILSRPEYRWPDDTSVLERVGEWVAEQIERLISPFGIGTDGVPMWVGWLVLAVLAGLVGVLIHRSRSGWRRQRTVDADGARRVVVPADDQVDWAAEVSRCEAQGRWREGLRARYRVLLADLARRDVIPDLVGRTAGELVADVQVTAPAAAPPFAAATEMFEAVWYGGSDAGPAQRDRFSRVADETREALDRGVGPALAVAR